MYNNNERRRKRTKNNCSDTRLLQGDSRKADLVNTAIILRKICYYRLPNRGRYF